MDRAQGLVLFSLLQVFVGHPIAEGQHFSLPAAIQAVQGSCVVLPCNSSSVFQNSFNTLIWYLWRQVHYPEVYNSMDSTGVLPRYKGRTFFVGNLDQNNCSLQINNVTMGDADEYYPWIDKTFDKPISLKVSVFPEEPTLSLPGEVTEGLPVMISCSMVHTCPPQPPTLAWDHLNGSTSVYHEDLHDGRWRVVLTLNYTPTEEDHQKNFNCSAVHSKGIISYVSKVFFIRYAPKAVTAVVLAGNGTIIEGDGVTLNCSCRGYPSFMTYTWFEGLQKVQLQSEHESVITLKNLSWDSGPYMCIAQNDLGKGESSLLILDIKHSPKGIQIVLQPSHNEGCSAEDTVLLMCLVVASNPPVSKYTWYKDGSQIPNESLQTIRIENMVKTAALERFTCAAHNEIGSSRSSSNFVTFTEQNQIPASCPRCTIWPNGLLIVILVAAVIAMIISVAVSTWCCLKNKKKSNAATATELAPISSNHISGNLVYTNAENLYTALDQTQISPYYEDVKRKGRPT